MAARRIGLEAKRWTELWDVLDGLREEFGTRLVFIGGIAVYLHIKKAAAPEKFIEFSHDGDFFISLADFSSLRDQEQVTRNPRLGKYQIIRNGFDLDIYLEHQNNLRVSFADAYAHSSVIDGMRVAALEHLLVLKLDAYNDRFRSSKGAKDARDLIRIMYVLQKKISPTRQAPPAVGLLPAYGGKGVKGKGVNAKLLAGCLTHDKFLLLKSIERSQQFMALTDGNAHAASVLRNNFMHVITVIEDELFRSPKPRRK